MAVKYLVTGAAGNLGSNVARQLVSEGRDVRALVLPGDPGRARLPEGVEVFSGDILDPDDLAAFFNVPAGTEIVVIHCAGIVTTYWEFVQKVYDVNVQGTKNMVDMCVERRVKKLVYVSSVHAIPELPKGDTIEEVRLFDPRRIVGFYGKTKAEASQYVMDAVRDRGLDASLVFPSGICGPGDYNFGHVSQVLIDCSRGKLPAGIEGGYDFVDVRDVAGGIVAVCDRGGRGEGYILSNRYVSVRELLRLVHKVSGAKLVRHMFPVWAAKLLLPFFRVYYKLAKRPPVFTRYSIYTLLSNSCFSHKKASKELGYRPRPFEETVRDTLAWLKAETGTKNRRRGPGRKRKQKNRAPA